VKASGAPICTLTVLDAIIGSVIAGHQTAKEVSARMNELSGACNDDPSGEVTGSILDEIRFANDLKYNPVIRRTLELRKAIGYIAEGIHFLGDRDHLGYLGGHFAIHSGIQLSGNKMKVKEHFGFDLYLRSVNCNGCDEVNLLYEMGHYLLLVNAINRFGTGKQFWLNSEKYARWVER
jgi:hypothetical protein